jgi:hypothetical protein
MNNLRYRVYVTTLFLVYALSALAQQGSNWVDGEMYTYITNGAWCWFQDERAVIDTTKNKLVVASTNTGNSNDVAIVDLDTKQVESTKRTRNMIKWADDHNSPGLFVLPNGNYIAMWAQHYDTEYRYFIYSNGSWSGEKSVPWSQYGDVSDCNVAYANLYYLSDEERVYACGRVFDRAPNFVFSDDNGESWKYGGQLTTNSSNSYNKGYYKYWGNDKDRIDMVFTEEHPRDQKTSIYHGYIQDHKMYNSYDEVGDEDIYSKNVIPTFEKFTKVFVHGTDVNGVTMGRCWQSDICRYADGTIAILFKARANNSETDHRNFYARFDGEEWKWTYIGKAGPKMYNDEQDYTGLGALNPDDPNRIYISSPFNPGDDNSTPKKREIWRGTTDDHGDTWEWEPVTANSSQDNFRPIIPKWKPGKEALLWFRGTYTTAQTFSTNIVGTFYEYEPPVSAQNNNSVNKNLNIKVGFSAHPTAGTRQMTLQYTVATPVQVSLRIFSLAGQRVATLLEKNESAGAHSLSWDVNGIPAGTYLARLSIGGVAQYERISIQH